MASKDESEYPYEGSDEASESELLDRSLSVWSGLSSFGGDDFAPIALDLHTACSIGHYDCVRNIIAKKEEDLNRKNHGGWTALMYASYIGYDTVVNLLLEAGVNVNTNNSKGLTSLMLAASCGNESVAYFLLQQGADVEARDGRGWTALFHATFSGHQNMVKFLLDNEANMNAVEPVREMTPFLEAAAAGHEIIVQYFLQHGVNVHMKNSSGDTARSLALIKGHRKIVSLIDNHVIGSSCVPLRPVDQASNTSVECFSSSDEAFPNNTKRPASRRSKPSKIKGSSIQDGPEAFEVLMDRVHTARKSNLPVKRPVNSSVIPQGYVAFANSIPDADEAKNFRYRDVTSPINIDDHKLDSSRAKDSLENDEDCNVFTQTGALTIRSSSSSSEGGLAAALKICQEIGSSCVSAEANTNAAKADPGMRCDATRENSSAADFVAADVCRRTTLLHAQPRTVATRIHVEPDGLTGNSIATGVLGVDKDALISLSPTMLTSRAYTEQRQMLEKRPQNLAELLHELNLSKYLPIFDEQDVDLQVFLTLTDNDLNEIGIKLFGPRKKMNVAIARWHSNARPSADDLEQAYADKLETEMQEMAIQLHQANNLVDQMRRQLLQEQELRSVTEACLMEDRATSQHICQLSADNLQRCRCTRELLTGACLYMEEISRRLLSHNGEFQGVRVLGVIHDIGHHDANKTSSRNIPEEICELSNQELVRKLHICHEELNHMSGIILMNTETILKKQFKAIIPGFSGAPPR